MVASVASAWVAVQVVQDVHNTVLVVAGRTEDWRTAAPVVAVGIDLAVVEDTGPEVVVDTGLGVVADIAPEDIAPEDIAPGDIALGVVGHTPVGVVVGIALGVVGHLPQGGEFRRLLSLLNNPRRVRKILKWSNIK